MKVNSNVYLPHIAIIKAIKNEAPGIKTLQLQILNSEDSYLYHYAPGQFVEVTAFRIGEAPFSITSMPTGQGIEISVADVGDVTKALNLKKVGDLIGIRGPYGNSFPLDEMQGKAIILIAGGIGLAVLRPLINLITCSLDNFPNVVVLYGCKSPQHICFQEDIHRWRQFPNIKVFITVDTKDQVWTGDIGNITTLFSKVSVLPSSIAIVCGNMPMIKATIPKLLEIGLKPAQIFISMERRMECGVGKCGHCAIGKNYVCVEGPNFRYEDLIGVLDAGL